MFSLLSFSSMPFYLGWLKYLSWMMYANEAMTIVQWDGVKNICKCHWSVLAWTAWQSIVSVLSFQHAPEWIHVCHAFTMHTISLNNTVLKLTISNSICGHCSHFILVSTFSPSAFYGFERKDIAECWIIVWLIILGNFSLRFWNHKKLFSIFGFKYFTRLDRIKLKTKNKKKTFAERFVCIVLKRPLHTIFPTSQWPFSLFPYFNTTEPTVSLSSHNIPEPMANVCISLSSNDSSHTHRHTRAQAQAPVNTYTNACAHVDPLKMPMFDACVNAIHV